MASKYGFGPDFNLHSDLRFTPDPKIQDETAAKRNAALRAQMVQVITLLNNSKIFGLQLVAEARNILEDLLKAHNSFKYTPHPYKEAPMLSSYYKALDLIKRLAVPQTITTEQEQKIIQDALAPLQEPPRSFLQKNFKPMVIGGSALFFGLLGAFLLLRTS